MTARHWSEPRAELQLVEEKGRAGGPTYSYRGATITCGPGGHVCRFSLEGHPWVRSSFGKPATIMPVIDWWVDDRRLPPWGRER